MPFAQSFLPEFDMEMANTRKVLDRIRDDKWDYKPHPKSGTMGWLAAHLANLPLWAAVAAKQDSLDLAPTDGPAFKMPEPKNRVEVLNLFDEHVKQARAAIEKISDADLPKEWKLLRGGQTLMAMPRAAVLRGMVMNHIIHHRAQLTVYLRLNDIPVPALYGPSADEAPGA